jgi:hypothetical protein
LTEIYQDFARLVVEWLMVDAEFSSLFPRESRSNVISAENIQHLPRRCQRIFESIEWKGKKPGSDVIMLGSNV